jgi:hypothetical protein
MSAVCFLAAFSDRPCDGRLVKCHLIPRRTIAEAVQVGLQARRRTFEISLAEYDAMIGGAIVRANRDERSWVWGCGGPMGPTGHHGMLDASRTLRIPRHRLPAGLEEFAEELGLGWYLDREYGVRERSPSPSEG